MRYVVKRVQAREQELIHAVVSRVVPFYDTSPAHIGALEKKSWTFSARSGEVLVKRGDRLPGVFAIAYGFAKLVLQGSHREGRVLRVVTAGQTFGEATALLGLPAPYDAVALSDSKLVVIPSAAILSLIDREPRFARSVIRILAERNLEFLEELEASTMRRGAQRLASYLGSLVPPDAPSGPCTVRLPVNKSVVAARLGLKKETLSRLFRQFAAEGLIQVSRGDITILDRGRLAETAS
jgi:CRP/FNR family transcriptional regulator, dissimilatory nitrate respiration regulator